MAVDKKVPAQTPAAAPPRTPSLGRATSTPIAFVVAGKPYLERMNVLAEEGAGILCETLPKLGERLEVIFRLSTAVEQLRAVVEVVGLLPTTPAGMKLQEKLGQKAMPAIMSAGMSDSATMIFRLSDLETAKAPAQKAEAQAAAAPPAKLVGFSVRFVELDDKARQAVRHHLDVSARLSEQLTASKGGMVGIAPDDRRIGALFDEGDLRARTRDW